MAIIWDDAYSVGVDEIDDQHKIIVDLINELDESLRIHNNREKMQEVIDRLVDYTKLHLSIEESMMRLFKYKNYEPHKKGHDKIVERLNDMVKRFEEGDLTVGTELLYFLQEWLFDHIQKIDMQYSKHFQKIINGGVLSRIF